MKLNKKHKGAWAAGLALVALMGLAGLNSGSGAGAQASNDPQPTPAPVNLYDLDGSGCVDAGDVAVLSATYGLQAGDPGYNGAADFTGDQLVSAEDYNVLRAHVGEGCGN